MTQFQARFKACPGDHFAYHEQKRASKVLSTPNNGSKMNTIEIKPIVIVPKLQEGFLISGFEINDVQGLMVRLVYHLKEVRREMHLFRTGQEGLPQAAIPATTNLYKKA